MSGLFKKIGEEIRERFDRDDKKDKEQEGAGEAAPETQVAGSVGTGSDTATAEASSGSVVGESATATAPAPEAAETPAPPAAEVGAAPTAAPSSAEGTVTGSGLDRTYTTKSGDTLEDIAAYFYGDRVQKQRLIDDNPFLTRYDGLPLPGGMQIHVSEDASRGDAVSTT